MGFLKGLFGKRNDEGTTQYFAGVEVDLSDPDKAERFLATQRVSKETALSMDCYLQLHFDETNRLRSGKLFSEGEETGGILLEYLKLEKAIGELPAKDFPVNKIYAFQENDRGPHQLGGAFPVDFKVPECKLQAPFQYLGYLDTSDEVFSWLPFRLHLICPIYLNIGNVWLDYSDPLNPVLLNREEVEEADCSYEDLNSETNIVFEETAFETEYYAAADDAFYGIGHAGVPQWVQFPEIPRCPKTNRVMKFLCQLESSDGIAVKESNVVSAYSSDYESLHFWGDGSLYVFFEPTSRIACYFIQNT